MTPTKEQIRRTLALPIGWRRALIGQEGSGWWCREERPGDFTCKLYEGPTGWGASYTVEAGWVWIPVDSLVWLDCCVAESLAFWHAEGGGHPDAVPYFEITSRAGRPDRLARNHPIDAALSYMEAHDPPEAP